jgi:hypothetical protein
MPSNAFLIGIVALAIVNGIFSPFMVFSARIMVLTLAPGLLIAGATLVFFFASLIAATATLLLAGVPAALFERATGRQTTDTASYAIWLAASALIAMPALLGAIARIG